MADKGFKRKLTAIFRAEFSVTASFMNYMIKILELYNLFYPRVIYH